MPKTLLVIGAGPGIGLATARRFAAEGYRIVLASRSMKNLQAQAQELGSGGASVSCIEVDAGKPAQVNELVNRVAAEGPLAVLYNAGVLRYDEAGQLRPLALTAHSAAEVQSDMTINLTSAMVAIRAAADAMAPRGEGSIFITGGGFGIHPSPDFLPISVAKAGIRAAAMALFEPLKAQGIHIGTVTVGQLVGPGSQAAQDVADLFWKMEAAPPAQWTWEEAYG